MRPNSTNADATNLPDARRKFGGDEDFVFLPIASIVGSGRFQQPSYPLEATTNRSNTDELPHSTSRTLCDRDRCGPALFEDHLDLFQFLKDCDRDSGILTTPLMNINHNLPRPTGAGNNQWSETMDKGDRDYPSRRQSFRPHRRPWECRIDRNRELVTPVSMLMRSEEIRPFRALFSPHQEPSLVHENVLQRLGLVKTVADQERSLKPGDVEGETWHGQRKKKTWETLQDVTWTCLGTLSHAPLAIASGGAYYMGKWRLDPERYEFVHRIAEGGRRIGYTPDTFGAISPQLHFAAIATTIFSLTAYHYILVQQGRDRDLLLLVFVGVGALAGSLAGLDGIEIVMRVVPWCAIVAFLLCAFVIHPRAQEPMTSETGETEELQKGAPDSVVHEKEAMMESAGAEDLKHTVGSETKTQNIENISLV